MRLPVLPVCSLVLVLGIRSFAQSTAVTPSQPGGSVTASVMGLGSGAGMLAGPGGGVQNLPYALTQTNTRVQTLADGTHITTTEQQHVYRDAEGRTRTETVPNQTPDSGTPAFEHVTIFDPVQHLSIQLMPREKRAYIFHMPAPSPPTPEQLAAMAAARAQAEAARASQQAASSPGPKIQHESESCGPQTIAGVYAEGRRITRIIPAGTQGNDREMRSVTETWTSPDLHITLQRTTDDPRTGKSTLLVTSLERMNPDPALFQVPGDYKVVDRQPEPVH